MVGATGSAAAASAVRPEIGEQRRVQALLGGDRAARVGAEHHGVARLLGPGPAEGQRAGVTAQVVGVLDDVVAKRVPRQ